MEMSLRLPPWMVTQSTFPTGVAIYSRSKGRLAVSSGLTRSLRHRARVGFEDRANQVGEAAAGVRHLDGSMSDSYGAEGELPRTYQPGFRPRRIRTQSGGQHRRLWSEE